MHRSAGSPLIKYTYFLPTLSSARKLRAPLALYSIVCWVINILLARYHAQTGSPLRAPLLLFLISLSSHYVVVWKSFVRRGEREKRRERERGEGEIKGIYCRWCLEFKVHKVDRKSCGFV